MLISELNNTASASTVYASSSALPHSHARLASGWWLAFAGRVSNPLDPYKKFLSFTSDILLFRIYPGATECKTRACLIRCETRESPPSRRAARFPSDSGRYWPLARPSRAKISTVAKVSPKPRSAECTSPTDVPSEAATDSAVKSGSKHRSTTRQ
jgi:hypothetical protein